MDMEEKVILVADDNEPIRTLYQQALELAGYTVLTADSGAGAADIALSKHPDVILMDILMPDSDGHEAVKRIRLDDWGKHASIIYLTNLSEPENVFKAFEQKPDEYIIKAHTDIKEVVNKVRIAANKY